MDKFWKSKTFWIIWHSSAFFFHFVVVVIYASALVWAELIACENLNKAIAQNVSLDTDLELSFPGQWKFLTRWNHTIQLLLFCTVLFEDIIWFTNRILSSKGETAPMSTRGASIRQHLQPSSPKWSDWILYSCALPLGMLVTLLFWTLFLISPEMVVGKDAESPALLNHIEHTLVGPLALAEVVLVYHQKPKRNICLLALISVVSLYLLMVFAFGFFKKIWIYGVLEILSWEFRLCFILACVLTSVFLYFLGCFFHSFFWNQKRKTFFLLGPQKLVNNNDAEVSLISIQDKNSY